jgi:hypothetical protein
MHVVEMIGVNLYTPFLVVAVQSSAFNFQPPLRTLAHVEYCSVTFDGHCNVDATPLHCSNTPCGHFFFG